MATGWRNYNCSSQEEDMAAAWNDVLGQCARARVSASVRDVGLFCPFASGTLLSSDVNWLRRCSGYFWEIAWCSQNAVQQLTLSFVCLFIHPIWMDDFIEGAIFVITSYNNWTCDSSNKRQENEIYRHKFKNEYSFNSFKYIYGLELSSVNTEYDPLVPS